MGGTIAQDFYSLYPDRVATLVLHDTSDRLNRTFTLAQHEEFVRLRIAPLLAKKEPKDMAPAARPHADGPPRTEYPDAPKITVPTLLVFGEDDRLTPPEVGCAMHAKIPGSQFVLIPTAGHLSNIEQPEAFNRAVLDFLQRAVSRLV